MVHMEERNDGALSLIFQNYPIYNPNSFQL